MQETIKRILEGNFDYESGSLDFSCAKIEISIPKGSIYEGSFYISSTSDCYTNGYVSTSDIRMQCLTPEFVGNDVEISFCFHGENMEEGNVLKGTFSVISNQGEYYLPFVVTVEHSVIQSSVGPIKNLFHFTNLAKSNWMEAVNLFYAPEFAKIFAENESGSYDCYRAFSAYPGNEQNLEEFLIQMNKKQKVDFMLKTEEIALELSVMENPYSVTESEIEIIRNGWGYTALQVECKGDFLFTEKEALSDDDFLGNRCRLPVYIDSSLCRQGNNWGVVYLYNAYVSMEIPVAVRLGVSNPRKQTRMAEKKIIARLMEFYQAFRLKKINKNGWLKETGKLVSQLVSMDEENVEARLFQAQMLITEERFHEAGWILDHAAEVMEREKLENTALWAYYLYLTTLIQSEEDYIDWVASEVETIYKRNRREWRVAWLLLYLSEEYNKSASDKWGFLDKQFQYGSTSPVLYIEALNLLNNNASVLRRLDGLSVQVLYFGARHGVLGAEVVEQLLYLMGKVKEYSPILEKILILLYEKKADVRVLQELCTLLIKGGKVGSDYYIWYERGVTEQLRITNLYEYYIMSVDLERLTEIPKIVLMYFLYQNNLDYEHTAFLYDYILQRKNQYDELYNSYRPRIERFVIEQIQKGHINRYLAALYQEILSPGAVTEQTAGALSRLLFAHQVKVEDSALRKVIVYQNGNRQPSVYHLQDQSTWIVLYGIDNVIVFEDAWGNRFMKSAEHTLEKLMMPGKYMKILSHYVKDNPGLDIYLCAEERTEAELSPDSVERYRRITETEAASLLIKRKAYMALLQHFYSADDVKGMEAYLEKLPMEVLTPVERADVIKYMVLAGRCDAAYQYFAQYGPYFADAKLVLRFADEMIQQVDFREDEVLLAAVVYAFKKGKYNSILLQYLTRYYKGLTKEMRDIWKASRAFDASCYELSERMLLQMLYSGAYIGEKMEVYRYYVSQGAKYEVEQAVLAQYSYDYFVKEKLTEEYIFQEIYHSFARGEELQWIMKLAFLKYYAENHEQLTDKQKPMVESILREMLEKKLYLRFFEEYKEFAELLREMQDRVIIEYRSVSGGRAKIHYVLLHDNGDADEYMSQYMPEIYPGVYSIDFILFVGETLQYYIVEENAGEEQLTESGSIQKNDSVSESSGSGYEMINDMIISKAMQDYETLDKLVDEYYCRRFMNRELFVLR